MQTSTRIALAVAALCASLAAIEPQSVLNSVNYDSALIVDRALALIVASKLAMPWWQIVLSALVWNSLLAVCFLHPNLRGKWREFFRHLMPEVRVPITARAIAVLAVVAYGVAWMFVPHGLLLKLACFSGLSLAFIRYRAGIERRAAQLPRPWQHIAIAGLAFAPAGIWVNILILDSWKGDDRRSSQWWYQAALVAVSSTWSCQAYQLWFGHPVKAGQISGFQNALMLGCRFLMYGVLALLAFRLLRSGATHLALRLRQRLALPSWART